jgi:hypothetical protein
MLKRILEKLSALCAKKIPFDPAVLNDPIALRTAWTPAKNGGASFQTHRLVSIHPYRMEFRPTVGFLLFGGFFMFMGVGAVFLSIVFAIQSHTFPAGLIAIFPMLIGLVFALTGGWLMYTGSARIIIDKEEKAAWKGRKSPREVFNISELKDYSEIKNIHALQLISEHCDGSDSSYTSYELNLVLADGKRINLIDHGNRKKLIADAQTLAEFLGVPLWNAL